MRRAFATCLLLSLANLTIAEQALPAFILEVPPTVEDVFIADAGAATMYHYRRGPDGVMLDGQSYLSIGSEGAGKTRAWDRKTPLGIYFVTEQLDTSRMHEKYGYTAFPLDYPNVWDRQNKRTGYGVWVHGVDRAAGQRPPFDTDGCLALPNAELRALENNFVPQHTPVIVTNDMRSTTQTEIDSLRQHLRSAVQQWAESLSERDLYAYLFMYSQDFTYRGMQRDEWAAFRLHTFASAPAVKVTADDLLLLVDPTEPGLYLSRFRQSYTVDGQTSTTTKRLYWRRHESGEFKIVAEDSG